MYANGAGRRILPGRWLALPGWSCLAVLRGGVATDIVWLSVGLAVLILKLSHFGRFWVRGSRSQICVAVRRGTVAADGCLLLLLLLSVNLRFTYFLERQAR